MKRTLMLLVIASLMPSAFCQADTTEVSYVAYWSVGDSYDFKVRKTSMQWSGDSLTKDEVSEYIANFEVIDSTADSYTIAWTYTNELISTWDIPEEVMESLAKYELTEVVYTTDELGAFTGIKNWKELGDMIRSMMTDVFSILTKDSEEKYENMMQVAQPLIDMYSTKEGVEQLVLPELQLFHFPLGARLPVNDTIAYEDLFPNLLGGDPIRADAKIWFEDVDFEEERSVLVQQSKLNPGDTMAFLNTLLARMGIENDGIKEALSSAVYEINTFNRFDYYYYPGVPAKIDFSRNITIEIGDQNNRRTDTMTIELL
jgi:hypothetical protein